MESNSSIIEFPPLNHPDAWEDPIYFQEIETPEIPASLLPGVWGEFATALAHATETPDALSVMTILGVISACVAKQYKVSPKEGWQEPINIYTLIALPPANNKSLVLRTCTQPLMEWEQEQAVLLEPEIKRQRSERKSQEKQIEVLRIKAAKEKDTDTQNSLFKEIVDLEVNLCEPPVLPALFATDATPESLAISAHEQGGRFAMFSDEGGLLETLGGLYSHGHANVDILLKGIDGGTVRVRRKDRSFHLNPYLTIVLTVQPAVIQSMGEKRAYLGNGTLERFLYVLPRSTLGYRSHNQAAVPLSLQLAYKGKVKALLDGVVPSNSNNDPPKILSLVPPAFQAWRNFQDCIEIQLRPEGRLALCQGWGGKICGFALRIAGLLHVANSDAANLTIDADTMDRALQIASALTDHAIAAYGLLGVDETTEDAKEVLRWFTTANFEGNSFKKSEIAFAMRHKKCGKAERLAKALNLLIDRNLISPPKKLPTRKPTTVHYIHPAVLKEGVK